ncbi:MAG: ion transporter [Alistipes sp.]|nr:ion transporter [Alistipes sp.]
MGAVKAFCKRVTTAKVFELIITLIIIANSLLIGVETYTSSTTISNIQSIILGIFTLEILMRFIAADSLKSFFTDGWNIFDLTLVIIGYIPASLVSNGAAMLSLRVLRVFRVLRLLRASKGIKVMVNALIKSFSALFYNLIFFLIFVYLFAIVGTTLFKLPDPATLNEEQQAKYELYLEIAPNAPTNSPDPYGTLDESMFTLFRALTGEDWTDLRYNLNTASDLGLVPVSNSIITLFHVVWFILSAFLLLNLVVGAIVSNYQTAMDESKQQKQEEEEKKRMAKANSNKIE